VSDSWELEGFESRAYHIRVCGPNGFLREFAGDAEDPRLEIQCEYARKNGALTGGVELRVISRAERDWTLQVKDHGYKSGDHTMAIKAGGDQKLLLVLERSHHWYDFSVTLSGADRFLRRFAGRVETGKSGFSDPVMGRVAV
jgi:phospholipase C